MKRTDTTMARRVDDELVILDVKSGRYFSLNDVGALVWDRLERDCTRDDVVDAVIADYEVDHDEASQDVDELIEQLANAGLVTR